MSAVFTSVGELPERYCLLQLNNLASGIIDRWKEGTDVSVLARTHVERTWPPQPFSLLETLVQSKKSSGLVGAAIYDKGELRWSPVIFSSQSG